MRRSERGRGSRGAALVEFVFVFPLVMMLFTGAVTVGMAVVTASSGTNAAREAARVAAIRYECADNHISTRCTTNPSTNYNTIKAAAIAKLGGIVPSSSITLSVQCRTGSATGAVVLCEKQYVKPDTDVVIVTVGWGKRGGPSTFVPWVSKTTTVVSSIVGRPDLSALAPEPDVFPPALSAANSCVAKDSDANGVIDKIEMTFDEDIVQSVSAAAFTLYNSVTGSNTISSASVSGRVVTLNLAGATVNTAIGTMNVSLAAGASGVRDLVGNQASFANCTLVDKASPKLISVSDSNVAIIGTDGKMDTGDTVSFTFSEPIGLGVAVSTVSEIDANVGYDTVDIPGVTSGPQDLKSNNYVTSNNKTTTFVAVGLAVGNTVTVTLGVCTANCAATSNGAGTAIPFTVSTSVGDAAGNAATGTGTLAAGRLF